ncbi:metallopeptidase family protein [Roseinatronobacter alkalisoli]|uniref:Metallopeptidase family protein n=1 Tax=Roseinatronobacter alkalisoli TaxID=3028235 RepID=A0ABT5T555_9RHOB|nr:metallopeptidase family protein [Roseinatronobacter sp. HJB301]MDD7970114.1 metallopeptidase family protein [Roseinatronobacter sp. HJB301]
MTDTAQHWMSALPPEQAVFEHVVTQTLETLPTPFRQAAENVALHITDFAPDALLAEMGFDDPFELTGLYTGIPLTEKSVMDQPMEPDRIWLFRRPILDEWIARGDIELGALIAHVFIHELAHHFGWSDSDIATIAPWQD